MLFDIAACDTCVCVDDTRWHDRALLAAVASGNGGGS